MVSHAWVVSFLWGWRVCVVSISILADLGVRVTHDVWVVDRLPYVGVFHSGMRLTGGVDASPEGVWTLGILCV